MCYFTRQKKTKECFTHITHTHKLTSWNLFTELIFVSNYIFFLWSSLCVSFGDLYKDNTRDWSTLIIFNTNFFSFLLLCFHCFLFFSKCCLYLCIIIGNTHTHLAQVSYGIVQYPMLEQRHGSNLIHLSYISYYFFV